MNLTIYKCNMNNMKPEMCVGKGGKAVPFSLTLIRVGRT